MRTVEPWEALLATSTHSTPKMHFAYLLPWIGGSEKRHACRFLSSWQDKRLLGLATLVWRQIDGHLRIAWSLEHAHKLGVARYVMACGD